MFTDNGFKDILVKAVINIYSVKLCQCFIYSFVKIIFNNFLVIIHIHVVLYFMLMNCNSIMNCMFPFCPLLAALLKVFFIPEITSLTTDKCA